MFFTKIFSHNQEQGVSLWHRLLVAFKGLGLLFLCNMAIYSLIRAFFLIWNTSHVDGVGFKTMLIVFAQGLRFDAVIIGGLVGFIGLIFLILPYKIARIISGLAVLTHAYVMVVNFVDIELINFVGRRFTQSLLVMNGDNDLQIFSHYKIIVIFAVLIYGLYFYVNYQFLKLARFDFMNLKSKIVAVFFVLIFAVVTTRGGFQEKPISYVDAKIVEHDFLHHVVLNSTFTFLKSYGRQSFQRTKYFDETTVKAYLNHSHDLIENVTTPKVAHQKNLVLFILESFSKEYVSEQTTPFLWQLKSQGLYFDRMYANGRRSVEGIAAILAGIPTMMDDPFLSSEFSSQDFVGLGHLFDHKGYHTSFFHGAKNGSMRFDAFTFATGFKNYFGKNEYLNEVADGKKDDDGTWGIYDGPFIQWMCQKLNGFPKPMTTAVFSLTSHTPFKVPDDYQTTVQEPVLRSVHYTDAAIKKFFDCAQQQTWFKDTIFVFIADHTGPSLKSQPQFSELYQIFGMMYAPDQSLLAPLNPDQYVQQTDLLPTFNDLFGLDLKASSELSRSLYQEGSKTIFLYSDQHYEMVGDTDLSPERLKAAKQYFSSMMFDNVLPTWGQKGK